MISLLCLQFPNWPHLSLLSYGWPHLLFYSFVSSPPRSPHLRLSFSPLSQDHTLSHLFPCLPPLNTPYQTSELHVSEPFLCHLSQSICSSQPQDLLTGCWNLFGSVLPTPHLLSVPCGLPGQGFCIFPSLRAVRGKAILLLCSQGLSQHLGPGHDCPAFWACSEGSPPCLCSPAQAEP